MKKLFVMAAVMLLSCIALGQNYDPRSKAEVTIDRTTKTEDLYMASMHATVKGQLFTAVIGCRIQAFDCSPLQVGDTFVATLLDENDPDAYKADPLIKCSIRITGAESSMVYFVVNQDALSHYVPSSH